MIFLALGLLGGKYVTVAITLYIALGAVGLPVFSGFRGGIGALIGNTGGYIIGFLCAALLYWLITHFFGEKTPVISVAMAAGMLLCYAFGTIGFDFILCLIRAGLDFYRAVILRVPVRFARRGQNRACGVFDQKTEKAC